MFKHTQQGQYTESLKLSMNNTLLQIQTEFDRIKSLADNEKWVKYIKKGILYGAKGLELANSTFNPIGLDLDGWGDTMEYSLENNDYDEVLSELYEKYKTSDSMAPEFKLLMLILGSGASFITTKKFSSMNESLGNMFNILQPKQQQYQPQQYQQQYQPQHQSQQQYQPQPQYQYNQPHQSQYHQQQYNSYPSQNVDIDSDNLPSRVKIPHAVNLNTPEIEEIIKTMHNTKNNKEKVNELDSTEHSVKIPVKKRGRPKSNAVKLTLG